MPRVDVMSFLLGAVIGYEMAQNKGEQYCECIQNAQELHHWWQDPIPWYAWGLFGIIGVLFLLIVFAICFLFYTDMKECFK